MRLRLLLALALPSLLVAFAVHILHSLEAAFFFYGIGGCLLGPGLLLGLRPFSTAGGLPFRGVDYRRWSILLTLILGPVFLAAYLLLLPWLSESNFYLDALVARGFRLERLPIYALCFLGLIPLVEEWWWRGQALPRCRIAFGDRAGLLAVVVGFSAYHFIVLGVLYPPALLILRGSVIALAGLFWCLIALRLRSWGPGFWGHLAADAVIVFAAWKFVFPSANP